MVSNVTELEGGRMFTMSATSGASRLALAGCQCDIGRVGHELTRLINRVLDHRVAPSALAPDMA